MTACTNKARGAVVAALAGVLALGAVPAVALATGTADAQVDLLVSDQANAFSKGTVELDSLSATDGVYTTTATGKALEIKATKVVLPDDSIEVDVTGDDYELVFYKADKDWKRTGSELTEVVDAGNYVVVVRAVDGEYAGGEAEAKLTVSGKAFSTNEADYTVYEVNPEDAKDVSDTTLIYTGSALDLGVTVKGGGDTLVEGEDYEVKFLLSGSSATDAGIDVVDAKDEDDKTITYVAYITGLNEYAGQVFSKSFTVQPFDLSKNNVTIEVSDVIVGGSKPTEPARVIMKDGTELDASLVQLTHEGVWGVNDGYKFTASAKKGYEHNVTGTTEVTVNKVAYEATFEYDGEELADSYTFYRNEKEAFDWDKLQVFAGDDELKDNKLKITVRNAKGTEVDEENVIEYAGTFEITVAVDPSTTGYQYGGSRTFTVTTYNDSIDADAQVFVSYDDKVITSLEKWYDGDTIYVSDFDVTVKKSNGQNASAYKVSILDSEGKDVTSEGIKDAGEYTLKVTSNRLEFTGTTEVPVTVHKADLTSVDLTKLEDYKSSEYLPINDTPGNIDDTLDVQYNTHKKDADGKDVWAPINDVFNGSAWTTDTVSIEKWDAEKGEWVKDSGTYCDEAGKYRLVIKGDEDLAKNFEYANDDYTTTYEFVVVDDSNKTKWFEDVLPTDWFFNCVNVMSGNSNFKGGTSVSSNPLIKGYADTNAFGPNNTINRADVAVILYRMAGAQLDNIDTDLGYSEVNGWVTGYDDVDGNMYYAKAIAWATKMGIVHGYDNGDFGPTDAITREQLATMLANFAKAVDREDVKLDSEALETMPDAGSVSTFAEKAVSWCVANELMGNDGSIRPSDTITRAETAAMAYNGTVKYLAHFPTAP